MKKLIFNYFFVFKDGFKIRKEDENLLFIYLLLIISVLLTLLSTFNKEGIMIDNNNTYMLSVVIVFTGVMVLYIIAMIFLYYLNLNNNYIKQLRKEIFLTKENKPINFKEYKITKFDFVIVNLFYTVEIGLFLSSLIVIILIYNNFISSNVEISYIFQPILSTLFIFLSFYFISLLLKITSMNYKIFLPMNQLS